MSKLYSTMPKELQEILDKASKVTSADSDTIIQSMKNMDITSLKEGNVPMIGIESESDIKTLCEKSLYGEIPTAAICVYPNQIETVLKYRPHGKTRVAVVNNFPHGELSEEEAATSALDAIKAGANEIDTVIDYEAFFEGNVELVIDKLKAVRSVCLDNNAKLKTIIKASIYNEYEDLYDAALMAVECGCDFVKTCTGKLPKEGFGEGVLDASNLEMAATVMQAVVDSRYKNVGVKISGGVKTGKDCAQMKFLADTIMGDKYFSNSKMFRFGASSLMDNLISELGGKSASDSDKNKY